MILQRLTLLRSFLMRLSGTVNMKPPSPRTPKPDFFPYESTQTNSASVSLEADISWRQIKRL